MPLAILAFGSNLGERTFFLKKACEYLKNEGIKIRKMSSVYESLPEGFTEEPLFLNMVVEVETELSPFELLKRTQKIERILGRSKKGRKGPRTIDIDIIFYNDIRIDSKELKIPHPRAFERDFVLKPLLEINPNLKIPSSQSPREEHNLRRIGNLEFKT
jgi:2-amino-4-hydroxy-6-hydroxymethyldihydropteridine diphosphokinase